jgi:WD40 repeat protein
VAFSPDGQRLASANGETVTLWDATTGHEVFDLRGHSGPVQSVAFSPDGQRLASAGGQSFVGKPGEVKLWDATTGQDILTLRGHTDPVFSVAFSPDGQRLASTSGDRTVRLWDATTGQEVLNLRGHTSSVFSVAFSPDGQRLASASDDTTVKLWDSTTGHAYFMLAGDWHHEGVQSRDEEFLRQIARQQLEAKAKEEISWWNHSAASIRGGIKYVFDRVDMKEYRFRGSKTMTTGNGQQSFEASGECTGHVYFKVENRSEPRPGHSSQQFTHQR